MHTHRPPKINEKRRLRTHIFSEQGLLRTKSGHACIVFDSQKWRVYLFVHAPSRRMVLLSRKLINSQLLNCWLHNAHRLGLKFGVGQCVPKKWLIYARTRFRNHSARKSLQPFLLEVVPRVEEKKKSKKSHISPVSRAAADGGTGASMITWGPVPDGVACGNLHSNWLSAFWNTASGQNPCSCIATAINCYRDPLTECCNANSGQRVTDSWIVSIAYG